MFKGFLQACVLAVGVFSFTHAPAYAQIKQSKQPGHEDKFRQLDESAMPKATACHLPFQQ